MTNTATLPTTKIALRSIVIGQRMGPQQDIVGDAFTSWAAAELAIVGLCARAPHDGTYDKYDFIISWEDGETYEGRYDAAKPGSRQYEGSLAQHCLDYITYRAGLRCPKHLTQDEYDGIMRDEHHGPTVIAEATRFLKTYRFDDAPVAKSPEITPQQARELLAEINAPQGPVIPDGTTAADAVGLHRAYVVANNIPMLPVIGNSFPVKTALWAMGGRWDAKSKTWAVPAYKHQEAQAMVDQQAKPKAVGAPMPLSVAKPLPVVATPAPAAKPQPVPAKPKAAPVKKGFRTPIQKRYDALITGMELMASDLPSGMLDSVIAELKAKRHQV